MFSAKTSTSNYRLIVSTNLNIVSLSFEIFSISSFFTLPLLIWFMWEIASKIKSLFFVNTLSAVIMIPWNQLCWLQSSLWFFFKNYLDTNKQLKRCREILKISCDLKISSRSNVDFTKTGSFSTESFSLSNSVR